MQTRNKNVGLVLIQLTALLLLGGCALAAESSGTCSDATMHGTYVYSYSGYTLTGSTLTRFAVAGLVVFDGNGTSRGVWTTATEGQAIERLGTFRGTYDVNSDCSATEIDTDRNGNIYHYDDFTEPSGQEISFVETDPSVVSSGTEARQQRSLFH